ncbi:hypothetical protein FB389_1056 [Rarobacter incanus]|uniref:Uncharacterized protein n=1 Tax=Rarobacter incanus TaxID=153494 RepID=A0A542SP95_9MICO|nr:hypothetical protein FB389_1056 [Rarobacter incanus]
MQAAMHACLAIPEHRNIVALASAKFERPQWVVTPEESASSRQAPKMSGGARFRGAMSAPDPVDPQFALTPEIVLTGPLPLGPREAQQLGLLGVPHSIFVLPEVEPGHVAELREWALAVAKHCWGGVIQESGTILRPDPESLVDLRLYSPDPQPMSIVQEVVRSVLPRAQEYQDSDGTTALYTTLEYDGTIVIKRSRATRDLPPALATVDWRDYGPHVYEVSWIPPDPEELTQEMPSSLHMIARRRAAPMVARTMAMLQQKFEGTVLDTEDFMVQSEALQARAQGKSQGI